MTCKPAHLLQMRPRYDPWVVFCRFLTEMTRAMWLLRSWACMAGIGFPFQVWYVGNRDPKCEVCFAVAQSCCVSLTSNALPSTAAKAHKILVVAIFLFRMVVTAI